MPLELRSKNLMLSIDLPNEGYNSSRFDYTGKIAVVRFKNILISGSERSSPESKNQFGRGFYNEFGIDTALGFEETPIGSWFHKIGIGLLLKEDNDYQSNKTYKIQPAAFLTKIESDSLKIICKSEQINNYSYILIKTIKVYESSFRIDYQLKNIGTKEIITDEYAHNFISFDQELINSNYFLKFPFAFLPESFDKTVNSENKVQVGDKEFRFTEPPNNQFFFSNLSGGEKVEAAWELSNFKSKISLRETGSFATNKINLWGWKHVISPELFHQISVKPGQSAAWSRTYTLSEI